MARVTIKLSRRYEVPGVEPFDEVELREPTYAEAYMAGLGKPAEWQPNGSGMIWVVYPTVVDSYLKQLTMKPDYKDLSGISARDGARLEKAVCGFFRELTD